MIRHFLPFRFLSIAIILASLTAFSCQTPKPAKEQLPQYWCWMNYSPQTNWDEVFQKLKDTGIRGVLLHAAAEDYPEVIAVAKKYDIDIHAWQWIMNRPYNDTVEQHPEWLSVNRLGQSLATDTAYVPYYKFLCPALPEVRNFLVEDLEKIVKIEGLKGLSLDYNRYVDVILPENIQPKYNIVQDKEYPEWDYGYHPAMIEKFMALHGYDPRELEDPSTDQTWKQFRYDQITEIANLLAEMTHRHGKIISASPFPTPTIARKMVRQDWDKWNLDIVFPMVYSGFYADGGAKWIADCMKEDVAAVGSKGTKVYCGLFTPHHKNDTLDLKRAMEIAEDNGASGIAIFSYPGMDSLQWVQMKAFIGR
ncbi:MAG: family 10 glycosylhydrolase [Saprospiraceae bacterium]|nr:family 10 glycosylhydrolase [Saprospiraceae bacterium]MCB9323425.1 family 10 glycosylhydrolase [Lewinellaceae bacterium]